MADTKISALTGATTPLAGTEVVPLVQSSTTKKVSVANLTAGRSVATGTLTTTGEATFGNGTYGVKLSYSAGNTSGIIDGATSSVTNIEFRINNVKKASINSSGSFVPINGGGIDFSASSHAAGMTSELLDDYEEGTWTPTFSGLTLGDGTAQGRYTKTGRTVFIEVYVLWGSTTSTAGTWYVTNIPFTAAATHRAYSSGNILDNGTQNYYCGTNITENTTNLYFMALGTSGTYLTQTNVTNTVPMTWTTNDAIRVSLTYTSV